MGVIGEDFMDMDPCKKYAIGVTSVLLAIPCDTSVCGRGTWHGQRPDMFLRRHTNATSSEKAKHRS